MNNQHPHARIPLWRAAVQWGFFAWTAVIGIRFGFFPALALLLFAAGIGTGMATGHWQSSLTYDDYRRLIPLVSYLSH